MMSSPWFIQVRTIWEQSPAILRILAADLYKYTDDAEDKKLHLNVRKQQTELVSERNTNEAHVICQLQNVQYKHNNINT